VMECGQRLACNLFVGNVSNHDLAPDCEMRRQP